MATQGWCGHSPVVVANGDRSDVLQNDLDSMFAEMRLRVFVCVETLFPDCYVAPAQGHSDLRDPSQRDKDGVDRVQRVGVAVALAQLIELLLEEVHLQQRPRAVGARREFSGCIRMAASSYVRVLVREYACVSLERCENALA
eukprot:5509157-Pleurochrysis_carterae.AAC.1